MSTKLADWLKARELKVPEGAKLFECHRITLARILPGDDGSPPKRRPGWKLLKKITAKTEGEITANDFMEGSPDVRIGNANVTEDPSHISAS